MIKKTILFTLVFLASVIVGCLYFFPLNAVVSKVITDVTTQNRLELKYDYLDVTFFGATMREITSKDLVIDEVVLDYNPLSLLLRKVSFTADSPLFIAEGALSGTELAAEVTASVGSIAKIVNFEASGSVKADIIYDIISGNGSVVVESGGVSFAHPMMNVEVDSIDANAVIEENLLTIEKAEAKGQTELNATGTVNINPTKPDMSALNISGTASLSGLNIPFSIKGPARRAKFNIN